LLPASTIDELLVQAAANKQNKTPEFRTRRFTDKIDVREAPTRQLMTIRGQTSRPDFAARLRGSDNGLAPRFRGRPAATRSRHRGHADGQELKILKVTLRAGATISRRHGGLER
jgi:hypothetical protein